MADLCEKCPIDVCKSILDQIKIEGDREGSRIFAERWLDALGAYALIEGADSLSGPTVTFDDPEDNPDRVIVECCGVEFGTDSNAIATPFGLGSHNALVKLPDSEQSVDITIFPEDASFYATVAVAKSLGYEVPFESDSGTI